MVTLRSKAPEQLNIPGEQHQQELNADGISEYEQSREERIRENRERMQKLGIVDLSLKLKEFKPTSKRSYHRKTPQAHSPLPPSGPVRRSSRLQNSTPVSYCELPPLAKDKSLNDNHMLREEGSRPEIYTEEHEKLLGSTERSWTFFADGYGKDGKRIYDPVKGKTCHQCRQKTLGHRTHCSKCEMVQGQFCGDCLYMRYGEHVLEANENPDWICPVCRGICNCSLCRQAKGWAPTGTLYRKISSLGYKSVAHYLIQTRRANSGSDENVGSKVPISAKRSLPFSDIEIKTKGGEDGVSSQLKDEDEYPAQRKSEKDKVVNGEVHNSTIESKPVNNHPERGDNDNEIKKELLDNKEEFVLTERCPPKSSKKRVIVEPSPDSIAARLRQRRVTTNAADVESIGSRLRTRTMA